MMTLYLHKERISLPFDRVTDLAVRARNYFNWSALTSV